MLKAMADTLQVDGVQHALRLTYAFVCRQDPAQ